MNDQCIFCKIASGEINTDKVFEDDEVVVFNDINPHAPVHVLVIPKKHVERVGDLEGEDLQLLPKMFLAAKEVARQKGIYDEGYRVVVNSGDNGGQTVYHLHMHVLGGRFMRWPPG